MRKAVRWLGVALGVILGAAGVVTGCVNHDYDACAGKAPGARCRICPQNDSSCVEPQVIQTCNAAGVCGGPRDAGPKADPNADHAWLIDSGGGFCLSWTGVEDGPDGRLWLGAAGGLFHVDASNPESAFVIDPAAIERGAVTALRRANGNLYAVFGSEEVVEFTPDSRATLGAGTSAPVAASDNGCVAVTRGDELAVRPPGQTELRTVAIPRPSNGFRLSIDAAIGLPDSLLVRTYRSADGVLGSLFRVSCPSLEVTQIAKGDSVVNLGTFAREDNDDLLAIDRYNGSGGVIRYRLMRSTDQGKTWNAVAVPEGWQSSVFASRGQRLVVAPPKLAAVLVSTDRGEHWTTEPIDTHTSVTDFHTNAVHIADSGIVAIGANCNYLIHRRTPLP